MEDIAEVALTFCCASLYLKDAVEIGYVEWCYVCEISVADSWKEEREQDEDNRKKRYKSDIS